MVNQSNGSEVGCEGTTKLRVGFMKFCDFCVVHLVEAVGLCLHT